MASERVQRKIDAFLDEAETALAHNDWQVALERARAAIALDRASADAKRYLEAAEYGLATHGPGSRGQSTDPQPPPAEEGPISRQGHPASFG